MNSSDILLIGPIGVGKTTTCELLGKKLAKDIVHLDRLEFDYFLETSFDIYNHNFLLRQGDLECYKYRKPFELYSVIRILKDYNNCIFDLGGGHSVYSIPDQYERLKSCIYNNRNIFLLTPYEDKEKSLIFLCEQNLIYRKKDFKELNTIFIDLPCNYEIANHVIYTADKDAENIACEIIAQLR